MIWNYWHHKRQIWNNRRLAFVGILVATSVAFIFIATRILPIAALPTFKLSVGGLPIKIVGYIFGPLTGAITGVIADLISFALTPTFINWAYMLTFMLAGLIPGIVGYFMNRRWDLHLKTQEERKTRISKPNFIFCVCTLIVIMALSVGIAFAFPDSTFATQEIINQRWILIVFMVTGNATMLIGLIFMRYFMKPSLINNLIPIITFSAIFEAVTTPLITLGDQSIWELSDDFLVLYVAHLILSPINIWVNLFLIGIAYRVVSPLIYSKSNNGWYRE